MGREYLGHLSGADPLYGYLRYDIFPQLQRETATSFRVFRLNASNAVYLYEERHTGAKAIGKFFRSPRTPDYDAAGRRLERELRGLQTFRDAGFTGGLHYVARPLGVNHSLNQLLMVEHCDGEPLDSVITRAISRQDDGLLFGKLTALAYFLASLHNRTAQNCEVDFGANCSYMDALIGNLAYNGLLSQAEIGSLQHQRELWRRERVMWEDRQVLVHGDATPSNFLFGDGLHVITFDLERAHHTDRVFDVWRLAGELLHSFLRTTGNKYAAEPFIGHFLWEYSCHFPDRDTAFRSITRRVPFYMGITLLRIARNGYLDWEYRRSLIEEAGACLRR